VSRELTRKELLRGVFSLFGEARRAAAGVAPTTSLVRPPGALVPDEAYLAACTGCEACVKVCPPDAIFMVKVGEPPRRVAVLDPARNPCRLCDELPCIAACADGALLHPGSPRLVRIGIAQVDPRFCRTFRSEACDVCVRACPLPNVAIRAVNGRPIVSPSACTGCGICAALCPDKPNALTVIPERDLVPSWRVPRGQVGNQSPAG